MPTAGTPPSGPRAAFRSTGLNRPSVARNRRRAIRRVYKGAGIFNRSTCVAYQAPALRNSQRGVTATEYALIIAFVALVMLIGASLLGTDISSLFSSVAGEI